MISLSWNDLVTWNGSQEKAFEELCCQLAHCEHDYSRPEDRYVRNGTPDAGVECTWTLQRGDVHGWQAKFFRGPFTASQVAQLDKSFKTAVRAYKDLCRFTVCLPINLPNARKDRQMSARQRWENCRAKWEKQTKGRVEIVLWDETALLERLGHVDRVGLRALWFGGLHLSPDWFRNHCQAALANLGARYRPAYDVKAGDRSVFDGLSFNSAFRESLQHSCAEVITTARGWIRSQNPEASALAQEATGIAGALVKWSHDGETQFDAREAAERVLHLSAVAEGLIAVQCPLYGPITRLSSLLASKALQAAVARCLFITGEAGTGKTHFLAWGLDHQIQRGNGGILIQGHSFRITPLTEMSALLGLPDLGSDALLGALDAHGERTHERVLILLDALNETPSPTTWQRQLLGFITVLKRFPHLALVATIRSTYLDIVLPDEVNERAFPFLEHRGFDDLKPLDLVPFFLAYGLQPPSFPMPTMEFRNPLVLHLLCEAVRRAGGHRVPQFESLTKVLEDYLSAVNRTLANEENLGFHVSLHPVLDAVVALAAEMSRMGKRWIPEKRASTIVTAAFQQSGKPHLALRELIRENVLGEDRYATEQLPVLGIGFTFERLADFLIARAQLATMRDVPELGRRWGTFKDRGVREVLSLLLAQEDHIEPAESFDLDHDEAGRLSIQHLVWRDPATFTPQFTDYLRSRLNDSTFAEFAIPMLVAIGADPRHPYNAAWLNSVLAVQTMPVRDARWSVPLLTGTMNDGGTFMRRFMQNGWRQTNVPPTADTFVAFVCGYPDLDSISPDQRFLASTLLCWMLTIPDRYYRGWIRKALVRLWRLDITLAHDAIVRHLGTDDPILLYCLVSCCTEVIEGRGDSVAVNILTAIGNIKSCTSTYGPLQHVIRRLTGVAWPANSPATSNPGVPIPPRLQERLVKRADAKEVLVEITSGLFATNSIQPTAALLAQRIGGTMSIDAVQVQLEGYVLQRTLKLLVNGRKKSRDTHVWMQYAAAKYLTLSLGEAVGAIIMERNPAVLEEDAIWNFLESVRA